MKERKTYPHETILWHPAGLLSLIALGGGARHVQEAESSSAAIFVRFKHSFETRDCVVLADTADFIEREAFRFTWCYSYGPICGYQLS